MIRLLVVLVCTASLTAFPYLFGARILRWVGPRASTGVALITIVGMASSLVVLLLAFVDPPDLPVRDIPEVIGRCLDAAVQFLSHPVGHWPQIIAALLLLGLAARLGYGTVATLVETRRTRMRIVRSGRPFGTHDVLTMESADPVACTAGVFGKVVMITSGALELLDEDERRAVLAHERAHVRGWHTLLLLIASIVGRAFGSFAPVRRATSQLTLGLEASADDAAVAAVGDPVVVARALVKLAERTPRPIGHLVLGAGEAEVVLRVRRLTQTRVGNRRRAFLGTLTTAAAIVLMATLLLVLPATRQTVSAAAQGREFHEMCHLPHDAR